MPNVDADLNTVARAHVRDESTYLTESITPEWVLRKLDRLAPNFGAIPSSEDLAYAKELLRRLPEYLEKCHVYEYPRPTVTVDVVSSAST